MRGIFLKGFFKCTALSSAPNGWVRKRKTAFPLPQVKRQKLLGPVFPQQPPSVVESGEDNSNEEEDTVDEGVQSEQSAGVSEEELAEFLVKPNDMDVPIAPQGRDKSSLYPSVVYEGDIAIVKLGVGQMVVLNGCAMVQVEQGQASMLGYSFPRGTDALVCSSSKLAEVITIEARHAPRDGRSGGASDRGTEVEGATMTEGSEESKSLQEALGCQLRFASHSLGQKILTSEAGSGRSLSFSLEFVGSLGSSLGKRRGRQFLEQQNQDQGSPDINEPCSDGDELNLDSEARYSDSEDGDEMDNQLQVPVEDVKLAASTDSAKKRKGCGQNTYCVKRRRVGEVLDSYSSATSVPHDWKEAVETNTLGSSVPVIAIAAYLNTDVGQPESTAPGCISLQILDSPVVGPPAMHLRTPESSRWTVVV